MATNPVEDALLRLQRADEHLDSLGRERAAYLNDAAGRVLVRFESNVHEADTQYMVFYIEGQPPRRWSPILSDFSNQVRSTLDNLVSALCRHRGGNDSNTSFPIALSTEQWSRAKARGYLSGLSPRDRHAIKTLQPFIRIKERPASDPLAKLAWLSNRDKHRTLNACFVRPSGATGVNLGVSGPTTIQLTGFEVGGSRTDLAKIGFSGFYTDRNIEDAGMNSFAPDIGVTNGNQVVAFGELFTIRDALEAVIDRLAPHFA